MGGVPVDGTSGVVTNRASGAIFELAGGHQKGPQISGNESKRSIGAPCMPSKSPSYFYKLAWHNSRGRKADLDIASTMLVLDEVFAEVTLMICKSCGSENQQQFPSEMVMHSTGLKNLNKPPVLAFPNLRVCMDCGFTELGIPESGLRLLGKDAAAGLPQTSSTQGSSFKLWEFVAGNPFSTNEIETREFAGHKTMSAPRI
jgi:hypothetical protein